MRKIKEKIMLALTLNEAIEYNTLVERDELKEGLPTEDSHICRCPKCGREFKEEDYFCGLCGQRVKFVVSDIIPL